MRTNEAIWIESRKRWQINVQSDGVRRTFTSSAAGKKGKIEAERKADQWIERSLVGENTKCAIMLDRFFEHLQASTSKASWRQQDNYIRNYLKPVIGQKKVGRITENDLQSVIDGAYAHGLAKKTLSNLRACIVSFIKYCRKSKTTTLHPEDLTIPKGAKRSEKTIAPPNELKILFGSSETTWRGIVKYDRYIHAFRFTVLTGIRPGELLGLQWDDINGKKVSIHRALNDDDEITGGKNDNAIRTFAITGLAVDELKAQRSLLMQEALISKFIFPDKDGSYTKQHTFRRIWKRYCAHNGISAITPYELRHTYVSVNDEMPEGLKKKVIGHSENMDTEGTYGHHIAGDMERAAEYSDAAFRKILGK